MFLRKSFVENVETSVLAIFECNCRVLENKLRITSTLQHHEYHTRRDYTASANATHRREIHCDFPRVIKD
jgi:hypothetical protein